MSSPTIDVEPGDPSPLSSPRLWLAAGVEIAVAIAIGAVMVDAQQTATPHHGMHSHHSQLHWNPLLFVVGGVTAAALIWWLATRDRIAALLTAAGLTILGSSETVRALALQSHLVAMAALEALLVAAPLLLIHAVRRERATTVAAESKPWTAWVIVAVVLNSTLLLAIHLPAVHARGTHLDAVPLWLALLAVLIGVSYWGAILLTTSRVGSAARRGALVIGQEVAAVLGLAALLWPSPHLQHGNPLGLSPTTDQRLGGVLMLVTCAVVTLPLVKRLESRPSPSRSEHDVH